MKTNGHEGKSHHPLAPPRGKVRMVSMTARTPAPVSRAQLERAGRVWDAAKYRQREAIAWLGYHYKPEIVAWFKWADLGEGLQIEIARGLAELWELMVAAIEPRREEHDAGPGN